MKHMKHMKHIKLFEAFANKQDQKSFEEDEQIESEIEVDDHLRSDSLLDDEDGEDDENVEKSVAKNIEDILTEKNPIKLSIKQKLKISLAGLSTNYIAFDHLLQFTKIAQNSGSELGHITRDGSKYNLYKFLSSDKLVYDNLDDCIYDMINMDPNTFFSKTKVNRQT